MALRRQDAEADADIASVLTESAWLPLDSEIERVESLLEFHAWRRTQQGALESKCRTYDCVGDGCRTPGLLSGGT